MKKNIAKLLLCLSLGLVFVSPQKVKSIAKFDTRYQINYQVGTDGKTHVNYVINQKNNLSVIFATDFGISINETKLENIKVKDEGVLVTPDIIKSLNQTSISFPFANKIVGKDKNHTFTIEYDTTDVAVKQGNAWQINIPRLEPDENITEQTIVLTLPSGFPEPAYIDPKPDIVNGNIYYFSGKKISNKPISAIFGKTQYYQGKLKYYLQNSEKNNARAEIALPPDTSYQTVYIKNIDPKPLSIRMDEDRNFLASYLLSPQQELEINLDIIIKIDFYPKPAITPPLSAYLNKNHIWNYDNSVFSTPEFRSLTTPKSIYDFVVDKLKYDYGKLSRKPTRTPASESLINFISAICTDFTDIFVALARKAGIYARELQGFAISDNPDLKPLSLKQDVLHAWPEYFDKNRNTWIQIDPTWANTTRGIDYFNKLDFNHIVFAIHGTNPEYPIPAGGYKNGDNAKTISIEPIDALEFPKPKFSVQFVNQENDELVFKISNQSGVSFTGNTQISGNDFLETSNPSLDIAPFSEATIRTKTKKLPFISNSDLKVIIYINGQPYETSVSLGSTSTPVVVLAGIGGLLAVSFVSAWGLYLRRRKQKTSLYR